MLGISYSCIQGVGVAAAVILLFLIIGLMGKRRRRRNASNIQPVYTTQPTQGYNQGYNGGQGYGNNTQYAPYYGGQQQQQTGAPYGGASYGYPPAGGQDSYAPPAGPPPVESDVPYAAPSMPPPSYQKEGEK